MVLDQRTTTDTAPTELHRSLSHRQINMIAIGGIIGTGLFVGSGLLVQSAGPAVILAYLGMGAVVLLVMRMLGEMAVDTPDSGSYAAYASREFGPWLGAMCSYMTIYSGIVIVALEATIIGAMLTAMVPVLPGAAWALVVAVALTAFNLLKVRFFGEIEFWLALVKVVAILAFIALGVVATLGIVPGIASPGLSNWVPFAPNGWVPVIAAGVTVLFGYVGAEQVVIMAAEAKEPASATRRAIMSVVTRILIFYIGSILVVITFAPSGAAGLGDGAYTFVLQAMGLPWLASAMSIVILFSLLSLTNTTIYTTSRMLFAAAGRRELPRSFFRVSAQGSPARAVALIGLVTLVLVSVGFFTDAVDLLTVMMAFVGASALIAYVVIALTQLRFRSRLSREQVAGLRMRMWWHPWGAILTIGVMVLVFAALLFDAQMGISAILTLVFAAACAIAGVLVQRRIRPKGARP